MKRLVWLWVNQFCVLAAIAMISGITAGVLGESIVDFAASLAWSCQAHSAEPIGLLAKVSGFSISYILLLCGVVVPLELLGWLSPYKRRQVDSDAQQRIWRRILLWAAAILSWCFVASFYAVVHALWK